MGSFKAPFEVQFLTLCKGSSQTPFEVQFSTLCKGSSKEPFSNLTISCNDKRPKSRLISYRSIRKVNLVQFNANVRASRLSDVPTENAPSNSLVTEYDSVLRSLLDNHAPVRTKEVPIRHHTEWYKQAIRQAKQKRRHCERKWPKSRLLVDKEAYVEAKKVVSKLIKKERAKYYQTVIEQNQSNPKKMFAVISGLLGKDDAWCNRP